DGNIFADEPEQRALQISNDGIDLHNDGFKWLPATEREKLLSQSRRTPGGSANFGDVISQSSFDLAFVQKQIAITENGGQEIIEIVRDAAGQLAERFHFLRAAKLVLQLFARSDVHERTD